MCINIPGEKKYISNESGAVIAHSGSKAYIPSKNIKMESAVSVPMCQAHTDAYASSLAAEEQYYLMAEAMHTSP